MIVEQLSLTSATATTERARELQVMSNILDQLPDVLEGVHRDLVAGGHDPEKGRDAMSAEQVLRALIIKQRFDLSYEELEFEIADSNSVRAFCRISWGEFASRSRLQSHIKKLTAQTLAQINDVIVRYAMQHNIESGRKTRSDCTVVETDIHDPCDSSLLWDCVRVLCRLMQKARDEFGIPFQSRRKRAKRRALGILNAKNAKQRQALYRDLLNVTQDTMTQALGVAERLRETPTGTVVQAALACAITQEIEAFLELSKRVMDQTQRRVLEGESVPASEKIVSIFEPHTDIIVKDRRDTLYGHKVALTTGASGLIIDVHVEKGNPADSTLARKMIERASAVLGAVPRQASFDGGFSSRANVQELKQMGVEDVVFSKHVGLDPTEMARSKSVFRKLRNFRAGIEAGISFLKRTFQMSRCRWKGLASFSAFVGASVLSCNLLMIARHVLA
jgi:IS5 family transposase